MKKIPALFIPLLLLILPFPLSADFYQITRDSSGWEYHGKWHPVLEDAILYTRYKNDFRNIVIRSAETGAEEIIDIPMYGAFHFDLSPDGKTMLFDAYISGEDPPQAIYSYDFETGSIKKLVTYGGYASFSPDGTRFCFAVNRNIYTANIDGTDWKNISRYNSDYEMTDWSPDGTKIAFASERSGNSDIWIVNADGTDLKRITTHGGRDYWPSWSPDNRTIAYTSVEDGNFDIWVVDTVTLEKQQITFNAAVDNQPEWSKDGNSILFSSLRSGSRDLWMIDL